MTLVIVKVISAVGSTI